MEKEHVYCFDFDGTLTTEDTLLAFIAHVHGRQRLLLTLGRYSMKLVAMKLGLYPNWKVKQQVFCHLFRGMAIETFDKHCQEFAITNAHLIRPKARAALNAIAKQGQRILIVSASIDNWVRPFFAEITEKVPVEVLGTQIEVKDGIVTGRFLSKNCYGPEKVNRIKKTLPRARVHYYIYAYGDSRGDKELLEYADEGHYKPFR